MNRKSLVGGLFLLMFVSTVGCGGALPSFGADLAKQTTPMGDVRVPYTSMVNYFGYVEPGAAPDEVVNGKKMFYLYLWIPVVAPEIGVRMVSPVANLAKPAEKGDFVDPAFTAKGATDTTNYFDTWVRVERCVLAINPEDITKPCAQWATYGENDDSSELPAQPSGSKYNSVLRLTSELSDPLKALIRGMYRIGFTTYKVGEVQGSFLAQVGAPIDLPGVAIARSPADLQKIVTAPPPAP
jgi:hypothetical protein